MSDGDIIGVDPLDWMSKQEVESCKKEYLEAENSQSGVNNSNTFEIKLEKQFDIRCLENMNNIFKQALNESKYVVIDTSEVNKVDAASMQYLAAFIKTANDKLVQVKLDKPNDYIVASLELMGLQKIMQIDC